MNAMTNALQDYRAIWRVTTLQRAEGSVKLVRGLALLALVVGAAVTAVALARHKLDAGTCARALLGIVAFWLGMVWTVLFVPGSLLLNAAANARLVPRQRRRLMQMAGGGWLLLTLASTALAGSWTAFPVIGIYLIAFTLLFGAANPRAVVPMLIVANWSWVSRRVLPPALLDALASDAALALFAALLVPAGAWVLRWMYAPGGDAQFDRQAVLRMQIASLEGRGVSGSLDKRSGALRTYTAALRRDAGRGWQGADPGRMLMYALGPDVHWSAWRGTALFMLAVGAGVRLLLAWQGRGQSLQDFVGGASLVGLGSLVLTILFAAAAFGQSLSRTRGEQALLRLAPLTGDTALLNRRLAGQLLRRALGLWTVLAVVILVVSALVAGPGVLLRQFGLCCLAGQVAMMGLLGDYAGNGGWNTALAWEEAALALPEVLAAFGLGALIGTPPWPWMAAIALGVAAFRLRCAWHGMLAAPVAFPARRMR